MRISQNGKYHERMSRYQQINDTLQLPLISSCQSYFYTANSKMSLSLYSRWLSHLHPLHFHNTVTTGRVIVAPSTRDSATSHPNFPNSTRANGKRMNSIVKLASQCPGTRKPVQLAWKGNGKVHVCVSVCGWKCEWGGAESMGGLMDGEIIMWENRRLLWVKSAGGSSFFLGEWWGMLLMEL